MSMLIAAYDFIEAQVNDPKVGNNGSTKPVCPGYFVGCWTNKNYGQGTEFAEYMLIEQQGNSFRVVPDSKIPADVLPFLRKQVSLYCEFYKLPELVL